MKKAILLLFIVLSMNSIKAQIQLGIIAGPNFSTQRWISNTYKLGNVKTRLQYHIGAIADIPIAEEFSVQPELLFSYQGSDLTTEANLLETFNRFNLGYLKLPVTLTYLKDFNKTFLLIGAGPYVSNLLLNNYTFTQNKINLGSGALRVGTSADDQITAWDYGIRAKAGFQVKRGIGATFFYDLGLKDVNPQLVRTRNRTFGISLFYLFNLGGWDKYSRYPDYYNY
jgi:outer membrane immunogenic protein